MLRSLSCIVCKINNDDDDKSTIQYDTIPQAITHAAAPESW